MSVKGSVAATVASRAYLAIVGLLMLPVYLRHMGPEAYGLVALFFVLLIWLQLLDLGLTPTMARETARHRAGARSASDFLLLLRSLEGVFLATSAGAGIVLFMCADHLAQGWLQTEQLLEQEVTRSLQIMALCIALRLLGELYRGVISGFERLAWLAGFNAVFGTLRLVLVVPFLVLVGSRPSIFFGFQLGVMSLETLVLGMQAYRLVPRSSTAGTPWRIAPIRRVFAFSLVMSLASLVWITSSQIDKLLLSGLLSLAEYGEFSLAVAAAAGVLVVSGSLADVLMPRMAHLRTQGGRLALLPLYRRATQWAGISAWSVACVLALHADRVLWIWTGDAALAIRAAPVLSLYALGNAALAVSAFPFYLQFAEGQLRLHLVGTALMVAILLPSVVWATGRFGGVGAAGAWLAVNVLYLLMWTPVAHARFMPRLHWRWMADDVVPVAATAAAASIACRWLPWPSDRTAAGMMLLGVSAAVLVATVVGSSWGRGALQRPAKSLI
jgi:O-antigen/teichoic acid export membrane protein